MGDDNVITIPPQKENLDVGALIGIMVGIVMGVSLIPVTPLTPEEKFKIVERYFESLPDK